MRSPIYIVFILLFTICSVNILFASKVRDLKKEIKSYSKRDTIQALNYIKLGWAYRKNDKDSAIFYAKKGLNMSDILSYNNGMIKAYNTLGVIFKNDADYKQAIKYYNLSLRISQRTNNKKGIANAYNNIGNVHKNGSSYSKALTYFELSLDIKKTLDDDRAVANTYNNIGLVHKFMYSYSEALESYSNALKIYQQLEDKNAVRRTYNNIAAIYKSTKVFDSSLEYYEKALEIAKQLQDKRKIAQAYNNIGVLYRDNDKNGEAVEFYRKSLKIREDVNDLRGIINTKINIGECYNEISPRKGLGLIEEGLELAIKHNLIDKQLKAYIALAGNYGVRNKRTEEIKYLKKALKMAKSYRAARDQKEIQEDLYKSYKEVGDYKEAFLHYEEFILVRDSLDDIMNNVQLQKEQLTLMANEHEVEMQKSEEKLQQEEEERRQQQIFFSVLAIAGLIIVFIILRSYRMQKKSLKIIAQQKEEVEVQKNIAERQKEVVEIKNEEILSSIQYAKRIQTAILPSQKKLANIGVTNFVCYVPKDIVSGDFYWFEKIENKVYFTAADCTGHGVPGAMVSVVCSNALTKAVREIGLREPARILDKVSEIIEENFDSADEDIADGMDLSLVCLDLETKEITFSGANNPLYIIRKGLSEEDCNLVHEGYGLIEIKADIQPIGKYFAREPFQQEKMQLQEGDMIYSFSDGFADQFGGPKGKKYKYKPFKRFLISIQEKEMEAQRLALRAEFENWRGQEEQIDDVCIVGVSI